MKAANMPEEEKSQVKVILKIEHNTFAYTLVYAMLLQTIKAAEAHIILTTKERSYYRSQCKESKRVVHETFTKNDQFLPPPPYSSLPPLQNDITVHFSFDMAQQVRL